MKTLSDKYKSFRKRVHVIPKMKAIVNIEPTKLSFSYILANEYKNFLL